MNATLETGSKMVKGAPIPARVAGHALDIYRKKIDA
jgi:hypothetical protein